MKINYDFIDFKKVVGIDEEYIDESIKELIYVLNKRNYRTVSCCSAIQSKHHHYVNRMYVVFKHPYDLPSFPEDISSIEYDEKGFLYIDYIGENDEDIKRVIEQWTTWAKNLPVHKEEIKIYCYSIIATTKNGRQLYLNTTYEKQEAFDKMRHLKDSGKYKSTKLKRTSIEKW